MSRSIYYLIIKISHIPVRIQLLVYSQNFLFLYFNTSSRLNDFTVYVRQRRFQSHRIIAACRSCLSNLLHTVHDTVDLILVHLSLLGRMVYVNFSYIHNFANGIPEIN